MRSALCREGMADCQTSCWSSPFFSTIPAMADPTRIWSTSLNLFLSSWRLNPGSSQVLASSPVTKGRFSCTLL